MAILKFRVYFEEDDSVYRDIAIRPTQSFYDLHEAILRAYDFDNKHKATFYRSNDHWEKGREISLEVYEKDYRVPPLEMKNTTISSEIRIPNQKFIYHYDFNKNWSFLVELINVAKDENPKLTYPSTIRVEGIAPSQYGTKGLLGEKFADVEEKYDLSQTAEGFTEEGESEEKDEFGFGGNGVEEEGEPEGGGI
jgi:pRiA4b ORF-3-like protein